MIRKPINHFPTDHRTVLPGNRASAVAKGVCAKFAVPSLPDFRRMGENTFHRLVTEGEECPNRAAFIDALMAKRAQLHTDYAAGLVRGIPSVEEEQIDARLARRKV